MPGGMELKHEVLNSSMCALCGACLDWCPYLKNLEDHLVLRFDCNVAHGRCYSLCPRTFTDWQELSAHYLPDTPNNAEVGPFLKVYKVKAQENLEGQQDGGTVSHLLKTALEEELVEVVLLTSSQDQITPHPLLAKEVLEIEKAAGSRFLASPSFRKLVTAQQAGIKQMAVVGRPCQIQALRKWDYNSPPDKPKLDVISIGLFCMWSLQWSFKEYLQKEFPNEEIVRIAIPQEGVEVVTASQSRIIPFDEVRQYIRPGCNYCLDMTAELADISVGALEISPGWNTVFIRSEKGQDLFTKAIQRGYLVVEDYPEEELNRLKQASLGKKARSLNNIAEAQANGIKPFIDLDNGEYAQIRQQAEGVVK